MGIYGALLAIGISLVATSESVILDSRTSRSVTPDFTSERGISVSGIDKVKNIFTSSKVSETTLQGWLTKGETAKTTFKRLHLTDVGENLFDSPQFLMWIKYVNEFNMRNRNKAESPIPTLTLQYGDIALFKMLNAAKTNPKTEDLAATLQRQQLEYWLTLGESPDDLFKLFGLFVAGKKVLEHPQLGAWIEYTKLFNNKYHNKQTTLLETMKRSYGNDNLQKILSSVARVEHTAVSPARKKIEQIEFWLKSGLSTDDVFKLYRLDKIGEQLFDSPSFFIWLLYMNEFNKQHPDKKVTLIATLATHYGDNGMATLLEAVKKVPTTNAMATKLQSEQMKYWLFNGKSPESVFGWLKLDKMGDKLLNSVQYAVWRKYDVDYRTKYPGRRDSPIRVVRYDYSDDILVRMIVAGKNNPRIQDEAARMETELFGAWHDKSPDRVFKMLNKNGKGFERPIFNYWVNYLERYEKIRPLQKRTMLSIMTSAYDDGKLASMLLQAEKSSSATEIVPKLQADQLQRWLDMDISPERAFVMLRLDGKQGGVLYNSLLPVWMRFLDAYNTKNPLKKTTMLDTLKKFFSDDKLEKIFIEAQRNPSTSKIATDLQRVLHGQ